MNASADDVVVDWSPYGNPIRVGYGTSMRDPLCQNDNPFNIDYQGAWHWRITCQNQNNGLPSYGFYNGQFVRYQYIHKETGAYKDLAGTPLNDGYEWIGDMPYAWDGNNSSSGVGKQFKVNEPAIAQDQDRLLNIGASNLKIEKVWTGRPSASEVYVKVYRITGQNYDPSKRVDYTNILGEEVNTLTHAKDGELIGEFVPYPGGGRCIKVPSGTTVTIEHVLMTVSLSEPLYYWVEECGYKDLNGNVHWNTAEENVMAQFEPAYSIHDSATNETLNQNSNRTGSNVIRLGPKNSNLFTITNTTTITYGSLKIVKTLNLSDSGTLATQPVYSFTVTDGTNYYYLNNGTLASTTTAPTTATSDGIVNVTAGGTGVTLSGLPTGQYTVTEVFIDGVAIDGYAYTGTTMNGTAGTSVPVKVAADDELAEGEEPVTVTAVNSYRRGSVSVTKAFIVPEGTSLPGDFKITAAWNDVTLEMTADSGNGYTFSGTGTEADPYTWTIDNLPIGTNVTFTESGYGIAGYNWSGTVSVNGAEAAIGVEGTVTVSTETQTVAFVNSYTAGVALPGTGGSGTLPYTIGGLALILIAGVFLVARRRRKV
jgi:LPXTG-motif cell wall-anchored protein